MTSNLIINSHKFSFVVNKLRNFFLSKKYIEVHTQNRLSILAACEDPSTISIYNYATSHWPLPQTGQMWLEFELLKDPKPNGYFCVSTSYRNEQNPIPGRHDLIFPMFEFELKGDFCEMQKMENELLEHLGYGKRYSFPEGLYEDIANKMSVQEITSKEEMILYKEDKMPVFFLKNFPEYTSPFWNMKRHDDKKTAKKMDIILSGMETIGSAERSCDKDDMLNRFKSISGGMYAKTLYNQFGKARVDQEMDEFLSLKFIPRSGGGIGITRLIRSMELEGLIPEDVINARS
jgi:aspartyl/asparaginyl-tRNA synthetase